MNKVDAIERLCKLVTKVGEDVYDNSVAHDCVCYKQEIVNAQIDEDVIKYIESAVFEALSKIVKPSNARGCAAVLTN